MNNKSRNFLRTFFLSFFLMTFSKSLAVEKTNAYQKITKEKITTEKITTEEIKMLDQSPEDFLKSLDEAKVPSLPSKKNIEEEILKEKKDMLHSLNEKIDQEFVEAHRVQMNLWTCNNSYTSSIINNTKNTKDMYKNERAGKLIETLYKVYGHMALNRNRAFLGFMNLFTTTEKQGGAYALIKVLSDEWYSDSNSASSSNILPFFVVLSNYYFCEGRKERVLFPKILTLGEYEYIAQLKAGNSLCTVDASRNPLGQNLMRNSKQNLKVLADYVMNAPAEERETKIWIIHQLFNRARQYDCAGFGKRYLYEEYSNVSREKLLETLREIEEENPEILKPSLY